MASALATLTAVIGEESFGSLLADVSRERDRFADLSTRHGGIDGTIGALRARLGVADGVTADDVLGEACANDSFDGDSLNSAARVLAGGSVTDQRRSAGDRDMARCRP